MFFSNSNSWIKRKSFSSPFLHIKCENPILFKDKFELFYAKYISL